MKAKVAHVAMPQFPVVDGRLAVGGITVERLAEQLGHTPFYAYDRELLTQRVELLRSALPDQVSLHYAMKANPMPAVVQHMAGLVDGLDVASAAEMQVALSAGMAAAEISFAGPGKTDMELSRAAIAAVTVNLESEGEMERLARIGQRLGVRPKAAIRVNPDFELKASGMRMSGGPKPFGVDAERVPDMLRRFGELDLEFRGFHIFSGSQNLQAARIVEAQDKSLELAYRLAEHAPGPVRMLNLGGGFGVPYFPGDQRLELQPIAANLEMRLAEMRERLPEAEPILELGRFLVAEAGLYVCRVIDRKISRGTVYLVTDGGLHHHLANSGNFGQVIRKNYPVVIANRMDSERRETATVVGPLCTPLDIVADRMELPEAQVGDLVAVYQSGAYGLTASPTRFLSHPEPAEVLV